MTIHDFALKYVSEGLASKVKSFIPKDAPPALVEIINLCFQESPKQRPNFEQIFKLMLPLKQNFSN